MNAEDKIALFQKFEDAYSFLSASTIEKIASIGDLTSLKKKAHFIDNSKTDKRIAFVVQGLFRGYIINEDGEEITLWFSNELDILASYNGILNNEKSKVTFEALEDAQLFVFDYDSLKQLASKEQEVAAALIKMLEELLREAFYRNERFILMDATQRYQDLLERKPNIIRKIPQKLLASYIGITPVSLSRLRAQLKAKKH